MKKSFYNLIIITGESFPNGMASTNRILCYASSIGQCKKVKLLSYAGPLYNRLEQLPRLGIYNNIEYEYTGPKTLTYRPNFLSRAFFLFKRKVRLLKLMLFNYKCDSVVIVSRSITTMLIIKFFSLFLGFKLYRETSETPENISNKYKRYIHKKIACIYDGIILISQGMRDYYSFIKDNNKFYVLPVLANPNNFNIGDTKKKKYFFYCSGANLERDGFLDSLKAFIDFSKINKDYKLIVATSLNLSDEYHRKAKKMMEENENIVDYIGRIPSTDIPKFLIEATALLVTPHHNYVTRGFPTKLSEYMLSGTPVICTSIDDLKSELNDNIVYMVKPSRPEEIKKAMLDIVTNPLKAKKIGLNARLYALNNFTMRRYQLDLLKFLKL